MSAVVVIVLARYSFESTNNGKQVRECRDWFPIGATNEPDKRLNSREEKQILRLIVDLIDEINDRIL